MKAKCGLTVANNVNRISIDNFHKCHGYWVLKIERSSVTFAGQESRPYSKTDIHFDDNNTQLLQAKHNDQDDRKWR